MDVEQTTNTDNPVGPSVVVVQDFTHVNQSQKREESPSKAKKFLQQLCVGLVLVAAVGIGVEVAASDFLKSRSHVPILRCTWFWDTVLERFLFRCTLALYLPHP